MTTPVGPTGLRWTTDEYMIDAYATATVDVLEVTSQASRSELISSACPTVKGTVDVPHLLLADIDVPCTYMIDEHDRPWLHVAVDPPIWMRRKLRRRLAATGLVRDDMAPHPAAGWVDTSAELAVATLCSSAETWDMSFPALFHTALSVAGPVQRGAAVVLPDGGTWLPLADRHLLVDSRTSGHHHLIGTRPTSWPQLRSRLALLARAKVVDAGWFKLARARGHAVVKRPACVRDTSRPHGSSHADRR